MPKSRAFALLILAVSMTACRRDDVWEMRQEMRKTQQEVRRELEDTRREARESLRKAKEEMRQSVEDAKKSMRKKLRTVFPQNWAREMMRIGRNRATRRILAHEMGVFEILSFANPPPAAM